MIPMTATLLISEVDEWLEGEARLRESLCVSEVRAQPRGQWVEDQEDRVDVGGGFAQRWDVSG